MVMWCVLALVQGQTVFVSSAHIAILTKRLSSSTVNPRHYRRPILPPLRARSELHPKQTHPAFAPRPRPNPGGAHTRVLSAFVTTRSATCLRARYAASCDGIKPVLELACRSVSSIARLRFGGLKSLPAASRGRILLAVIPKRHTRAYHILRRSNSKATAQMAEESVKKGNMRSFDVDAPPPFDGRWTRTDLTN
ncbi:hypothetical protein HETIRDRAFT_103544 [Heterobasidion irregulare TC 32-1]|uniref:Secreted protein n=1 Tax=Heterobasidion irregulare (strain TC 32-1) TaxID=747525 RepID=W4K2D0_HETIT|nr:uncharacterized protein HETIRDRAFT_103544 [Heterobasidion irregulare TC 32-1]ETW79879.1 hypothetical protein HETIRDRAFT_103544 [Heterobasidion irregulare TC 32-1]